MHLHPELRALRDDDAPQRHAQDAAFAALAAWRESPVAAPVLADIKAFATTRSFVECPALAALFDEESGAADALIGGFIAAMAATLAAQPLAHLALPHHCDDRISTLLLARAGGVSLLLTARAGERACAATPPLPTSASFADVESWERVLAGHAAAELVALGSKPAGGDARLTRRPLALAPGTVVGRSGKRQALVLQGIDGVLVTLRLQRRSSHPLPTEERDLASGAVLHRAAGSLRESRQQVAVALLGSMGRSEAVPVLADIAQDRALSDGLRWDALRQCLTLDTAAGFAALTALATHAADALAGPAGALRAHLLETWPQLRQSDTREHAPCLLS